MATIHFSIDERQYFRLLQMANDKNLSVDELLRNLTKAELDRVYKKKENNHD